MIQFDREDMPWAQVPEHLGARIRDATTVDALVDAMLSPEAPWPQNLQVRLLHPAGAVAAVLAAPLPGMRVLNLGTGWPALSPALASLGARVTSADHIAQRLRFEQLVHDLPADAAVHLSLASPLPWLDASFGRVFLDVGEVTRAGGRLARVLAEARRVLTGEGKLVLGLGRGPGDCFTAPGSPPSASWCPALTSPAGSAW